MNINMISIPIGTESKLLKLVAMLKETVNKMNNKLVKRISFLKKKLIILFQRI